MKKIKKILKSKKGAISLIGIMICIITAIFIQGYLDTSAANFILEETQSILDLTTLTTLESTIDTEGLRYERMTLIHYNYDYEANHVSQNTNLHLLEVMPKNGIDNRTQEQKEISDFTIWIDGRNAHYIENYCQVGISNLLKKNFEFYLNNFLIEQLHEDGINILDLKLTSFVGTLSYDNWGINRKYGKTTKIYEGIDNQVVNMLPTDYIKMPQTTIDAIIQLKVDVDQTFTTGFYDYVLYNAQQEAGDAGMTNAFNSVSSMTDYNVGNGTYLIHSGFDSERNLILTIRVLARQTFY